MSEKKDRKFFFEEDPRPHGSAETDFLSVSPDAGSVFASDLKGALDISDQALDMQPKIPQVAGEMKTIANAHVEVEYGTYEENYSVHITPIHPKYNLQDDQHSLLAIQRLIVIMNDYVPYDMRVEVFPPGADWKRKVISAKIIGAANAWNFDVQKFESQGVPRILESMQSTITERFTRKKG